MIIVHPCVNGFYVVSDKRLKHVLDFHSEIHGELVNKYTLHITCFEYIII